MHQGQRTGRMGNTERQQVRSQQSRASYVPCPRSKGAYTELDCRLWSHLSYLQLQRAVWGSSSSVQASKGHPRWRSYSGTGAVEVRLKLPGEESKVGRLNEVLYVPTLAYNLLNVAKATEAGKVITFGETQWEVISGQGEVVAVALKAGSLYYLNCEPLYNQQINSASHQSKENLWHWRFGHLGETNLGMLKKSRLVNGFDFCEPCVSGKIHWSGFPKPGRERAEEPLGLVHSDLCGKISSPSLSHAEYFVTFIDDKTHYVWIYVVKHKHEVFQKLVE